MPLTKPQQNELRQLWPSMTVRQLAKRYKVTEGSIRGYRTRLHLRSAPDPAAVKGLTQGHPAVQEGRSLFPGMVTPVPETKPVRRSQGSRQGGFVLVSGANSVKYGAAVTKNAWAGFPIYSLTLEERRTCPSDCLMWYHCYGNSSHWQKRYQHGEALEQRLGEELAELQQLHPGGFVVRLHTLGDFYSIQYARLWLTWLQEFPALHVFGYTAWKPDTEIGGFVNGLAQAAWYRFAVRLSTDEPGPRTAKTLFRMPSDADMAGALICPYEEGKTDSCGTCGLCWAKGAEDKAIIFLAHGK